MQDEFKRSLLSAEKCLYPWEYRSLANCLSQQQILEVTQADIRNEGMIMDGTRAGNAYGGDHQNHNIRTYITQEKAFAYPDLSLLIRDLRDIEVRKHLASTIGWKNNFDDAFIRVEVIWDRPGFWLKTHCDIPEKILTMMIYVNDENLDELHGTDLYTNEDDYVTTVPYRNNTGFYFWGADKWHGVGKKRHEFGVRKALQINYVTFPTDWPVTVNL